MKMKLTVAGFAVLYLLFAACNTSPDNREPEFNAHPSTEYLSPEESLKTMYLPEGYHMELVASEPLVQEPVAMTWDANGRMYVAEMLTYMQDAEATGEQLPYSRIVLLEDEDHDGKMDKSTVFIDSLLLPRMMQAAGNELLVNETNSITLTSYSDTNGDGKADTKRIVYKNDKYVTNDANMEHQRSGLDWNLDNWMYVTYEPVRFRYTDGAIQVDSIPSGGSGQWGLTHDDYGRLFFSNAGGEIPVLGFQVNPVYGKLDFPDQFDAEFQEVWPIIATPDVQGGNKRLRPDNTLNHFTASCGQSIFRGDNLPKDMEGDYIVCEPVARIIRRAKVYDVNGKTILKNAYDKKEFISSADMNFRPVNTATGPDGNLYIADMYRGIIQQANWTRKGSFIRGKIDSLGLAKNIGRGRIYRVVHDGFKRGLEKPNMLDQSPAELLQYLGHPNGWWRDNAQRMIIIKNDKSVVPALKAIARGQNGVPQSDTGHLARIHALWTLEGLDAIDQETLLQALQDKHPQVRKAAVWISEMYLKKDDKQMIEAVAKLKDDADVNVRVQVALSMYHSGTDETKKIADGIIEQNKANEMIAGVKDALDKNTMIANLAKRLVDMPEKDKSFILRGSVLYRSVCMNCHGGDGMGLAIGKGMTSAPPLVGSDPLSSKESNTAIRILLNGLSGPVEGKTYPSEMPTMGANSDSWIAAVLSYARYEFGYKPGSKRNSSAVVTSGDVRKLREESKQRNKAWTLEELKRLK